MFRDMSGLAQTAALAQAGVQASAQGATAAGQQAANTLATVMANNTERMRIAAQLLAGTGGLGGGGGGGGAGAGGQQPPGKGTVSERGGELNAAQSIGNQIDQGSGAPGESATTTQGQDFLLAAFRRQTGGGGAGGGGSGGGTGGGGGSQSSNIYLAPNWNSGRPPPADQTVRFKVVFEYESGTDHKTYPLFRGDKSERIESGSGYVAWSRPFLPSFMVDAAPTISEILSPRLWNDQTFEYYVSAGVRFNPFSGSGSPARDFSTQKVKIDMPKTGIIQLTVTVDTKTTTFSIPATSRTQAFNTARARLIAATGINEAMLESFTAPQTPTNGQFDVAITYYTGILTVTDVRKVQQPAPSNP